MAIAAESSELQTAFREHLDLTRIHLERLEAISHMIESTLPRQHCEGMEGLIREGEETLLRGAPSAAQDAALIAAAQRVEHYEIAAYEHCPHARRPAEPRRGDAAARQHARRGERRRQGAQPDRDRADVPQRREREGRGGGEVTADR
jgi:hypothetical protein